MSVKVVVLDLLDRYRYCWWRRGCHREECFEARTLEAETEAEAEQSTTCPGNARNLADVAISLADLIHTQHWSLRPKKDSASLHRGSEDCVVKFVNCFRGCQIYIA
jgi:hypothetical protein